MRIGWHSCQGGTSEIKTADLFVVTFPPSWPCICAALPSHKAFQRKETEIWLLLLISQFSRQIISGLCPLAPTLCPSRSLRPIIKCHSFHLFISSSLGWVEAIRNPLISGSWLCSLHGELWSYSGKQPWSGGEEGELVARPYFNLKYTTSRRGTAGNV